MTIIKIWYIVLCIIIIVSRRRIKKRIKETVKDAIDKCESNSSEQKLSSQVLISERDVSYQSEQTKQKFKEHFGIPEDKIHVEAHSFNNEHKHDPKDILCRANQNVKDTDVDFRMPIDEQSTNETCTCMKSEKQTESLERTLDERSVDDILTEGYDGSEFLNNIL